METKIENNFLNLKEIELISTYIDNELKHRQTIVPNDIIDVNTEVIVLQKNIGRIVMHFNIHKIPEEIYARAYWYAKGISQTAIPNTFMFSRYSLEYGAPRLLPHIDQSNTDFTIDYQLRSNISWPLVVENKEYLLEDNDALIFKSSDYIHWRTPTIFKKDDYVDMLFFHFIDESKKNNLKRPATIKGDYIFDYYKQAKQINQ